MSLGRGLTDEEKEAIGVRVHPDKKYYFDGDNWFEVGEDGMVTIKGRDSEE